MRPAHLDFSSRIHSPISDAYFSLNDSFSQLLREGFDEYFGSIGALNDAQRPGTSDIIHKDNSMCTND